MVADNPNLPPPRHPPEAGKQAPESLVGRLMACYWPECEPKVVWVVKSAKSSLAPAVWVWIANTDVEAVALLKNLREFDRAEFEAAVDLWRFQELRKQMEELRDRLAKHAEAAG
jgi:hypothetical protein